MTRQLELQFPSLRDALPQLWTPDDIYDRIDSQLIGTMREDRRVERKGPATQPRTLGEYLCMWANTQPHGGLIFFGIEDNGDISGCRHIDPVTLNKIESLSQYCPDARWQSKRISVKDRHGRSNFLVVFRVFFRHDKLVETSRGECFIREGDKKIRLNDIQRREIKIARGEIHYELEEVNLTYPDDFVVPQIEQFCVRFLENRNLRDRFRMEDILCLAKLGKIRSGKFRPNLACALMFASDMRELIPGCRIRILKYEGKEEQFGSRLNIVFDRIVDGNVPQQIQRAEAILDEQIRSFTRLGRDGRFQKMPEYPKEAWLEAVVNAVAHRSYNLKHMNTFIKVFDDKFAVESPGGFVPPTTARTVYNAHNPRNPYLMEALFHLDFVKCGYEGTRRMRTAMQEAGLPAPVFEQKELDGFAVHVFASKRY